MKIIERIERMMHPKTNIEEIACLAIRSFELKVPEKEVMSKLKRHPNSSSLLAVYDILAEYGVSSVAMKCDDFEKLIFLKHRFIAQVRLSSSDQEVFAFVYSIEEGKVVLV